jgi:hypothetical protein
MQQGERLSKREVLEQKLAPRSKRCATCPDQDGEEREHACMLHSRYPYVNRSDSVLASHTVTPHGRSDQVTALGDIWCIFEPDARIAPPILDLGT